MTWEGYSKIVHYQATLTSLVESLSHRGSDTTCHRDEFLSKISLCGNLVPPTRLSLPHNPSCLWPTIYVFHTPKEVPSKSLTIIDKNNNTRQQEHNASTNLQEHYPNLY